MITKYSDAYNVLFEKATERLAKLEITKTDDKGIPTGEPIVIGSLEEYFSHLKDLVYGDGSLTKKELQDGYLFLKLPLDEPAFKIDANSRAIEIPGHYLANGLSVQGDEVAEIVFFEIDRFFDATDLSMQSISIQWETPKGVQGHTEAFIRDIESKAEEDKLIFGWPITSDVTKVPGKLKFSVRFYTEDARYAEEGQEKGFSYVFSTLPATISINAGLTMDTMQVDADNATDLILGRLTNSPIGGIGDASVPVFVYWDPRTNSVRLADTAAIIDQVEEGKPVTLAAVAAKGDSGIVTYGWFHSELGALTSETHDGWQTASAVDGGYGAYLPVTEYIDDIATYFYYDNEGQRQKVVIYPEDFATELERYGELFINCSILTLTSENVLAGEYFVNAKNTYYGTKAFATEVGKENKALLPKWKVNGPDVPVIMTDLKGELLATITDENASYDGQLEIVADKVDAKTTYTWTYTNYANVTTTLEATGSTYSPFNGIDYNEGKYQVTLSNFKNNKTVETASAVCLVLNPIEEITMSLQPLGGGIIQPKPSRAIKDYEVRSYKWYDYTSGPSLDVVAETEVFTAPKSGIYHVEFTTTKGSQVKTINSTITIVL